MSDLVIWGVEATHRVNPGDAFKWEVSDDEGGVKTRDDYLMGKLPGADHFPGRLFHPATGRWLVREDYVLVLYQRTNEPDAPMKTHASGGPFGGRYDYSL